MDDHLKDLIAKLVIDAELPFEFVEGEAFRKLLQFMNPKVQLNLPKADSLEAHVKKINRD